MITTNVLNAEQMMLCAIGGFFILYGAHAYAIGYKRALKWGWGAGGLFVICAFTLAGCVTTPSNVNEGEYMNNKRGLPPPRVDTNSKDYPWKHKLKVSLKNTDRSCLANAIVHTYACNTKGELKEGLQFVANQLDDAIRSYELRYGATVEDALRVANDEGLEFSFFKVTSFEQYKNTVKLYPVLICHDMFYGMTDDSPFFNGFIAPSFGRIKDERGNVRRHAAVVLGRHEGRKWTPWVGKYSVYKNSLGPGWGERFGEAKITDAELEDLFEIGNVEAFAIVK